MNDVELLAHLDVPEDRFCYAVVDRLGDGTPVVCGNEQPCDEDSHRLFVEP